MIFTRENITFIFSIIGALGTLYTLCFNIFSNRPSIHMELLDYNVKETLTTYYVLFANKSKQPIAITDIVIKHNKTEYKCNIHPQYVKYCRLRSPKGTEDATFFQSATLPIILPSLSGTSEFLVFDFPKEIQQQLSKHAIFEVTTNRHKKFRMKL